MYSFSRVISALLGIFLLFSALPVRAYTPMTVAELQNQCQHVKAANPTSKDIQAAANCKGFVQAVLENYYGVFNCPSYQSLTLQNQIELFLVWATAHPESAMKAATAALDESSENIISKCECPMPPGCGLSGHDCSDRYYCRKRIK